MPGTDTKVTPDSEEPIIPKATMYQGDLRLPRKKAAFSECFRPIKYEMVINAPKYRRIISKMYVPFILFKFKIQRFKIAQSANATNS
jgi:hypothetical protein